MRLLGGGGHWLKCCALERTDCDPLQVILAEESASCSECLEEQTRGLVDCGFSMELMLVSIGVDSLKVLEVIVGSQVEEGERPEGWVLQLPAKFSWCLGMLTEGFKEEDLLKRMKERIDQKGHEGTNRRVKSLSSRFERELKKLEWIVKIRILSWNVRGAND